MLVFDGVEWRFLACRWMFGCSAELTELDVNCTFNNLVNFLRCVEDLSLMFHFSYTYCCTKILLFIISCFSSFAVFHGFCTFSVCRLSQSGHPALARCYNY